MKLRCHLKEILEGIPYTERAFASEVKIGTKQVSKLLVNEGWRLDKDSMERIHRFLFAHGNPTLFSLAAHPVWRTFEGSKAVIYRASRGSDATVEQELRNKFLETMGCRTEARMVDPGKAVPTKTIQKAMADQNCIFVGTPKFNAATEVALAHMYGATPFDASRSNRDRIRVQVIGMSPRTTYGRSAVLVPGNRRHGFVVGADPGAAAHYIEVSHWSDEEFARYHGPGHDAAVAVFWRLGQFTTTVLMGYTGRATLEIARQLTHGDPPIKEDELADGAPHVVAYRFDFVKRTRSTPAGPDTRAITPNSGVWAPPWHDIVS